MLFLSLFLWLRWSFALAGYEQRPKGDIVGTVAIPLPDYNLHLLLLVYYHHYHSGGGQDESEDKSRVVFFFFIFGLCKV